MSAAGLTERLMKRDRHIVMVSLGLLLVLAGLYTVFGVGMRMSAIQMTAMSGMQDMPGMNVSGRWSPLYSLLVFMMWWMMMVAMMLPSVAPTVLLHAVLLRSSRQPGNVPLISSVFLAGYLFVWALFSLVAAVTQWTLEYLGLVSATMMTLIGTFPGALLLIAAGAFQFTPLKTSCLQHCRSPVRFLTERRRPGSSGAFAMGMEHGAYCLGCCWFLMALLFVGGIMNLYWIVGLAAFVALEKLMPFGTTLAKVAGGLLVAAGSYALVASF